MKLRQISESNNQILDHVFVFKGNSWLDPDVPLEQAAAHFTEMFRSDPPPGITPVKAAVGNVVPSGEDDDMVTYDIKMSLEDFIRNSIEYGIDPYEILKDVKQYAGSAAAKVAYEFMKNDNDFKVARIGKDEEGHIKHDSYNAKLDL